MNIFNKLMKQSIKCQVKIGSNYISVCVQKQTTCTDFLNNCLSRCKLTNKNLHKGYMLIERCNGIERNVRLNENIFELIKKFKREKSNFDLVIKKIAKSTKFLKIKKDIKKSKRIFKILDKQPINITNRNDSHFYEDIQDLSSSQNEFLKQHERSSRVIYSLETIQNIRKKLQSRKVFDQEFIL